MPEQRKKRANPVLRVFGVLLLVVVLLAGGLYLMLVTDPLAVDEPKVLAAQTPMAASQRFVFDAANETARIRLDKNDLWFLLLPDLEETFLDELNGELENYQLRVSGYGFEITKKGIRLDVEAWYKALRLPVHVFAFLECDAAGASVRLNKARLGLIPLPVSSLLGAVDMRIHVDWPVVSDITDVTYEKDAVVLTGTLTQDMLSCVQKVCKNDAIGWFSHTHQNIFHTARKEDGYRDLLPELQQDPGSVEALYHDMFTLAQVDEYEDFMEATRNLAHRFFPGIDFDAWEKENDSVRSVWIFGDVWVDRIVAQVSIDFNKRRFSLKDGEFYLGKSEFDVLNYFQKDTAVKVGQLFQSLDLDSFHLVLVDADNSYHQKSPVLSWVCPRDQQLTQELDRYGRYAVGCVFQGVGGDYFLRYESVEAGADSSPGVKSFTSVPLSDAEYADLTQEGKIGVWIAG